MLCNRAQLPSKPVAKPMERLPSLSYSIMNENALRKKISTLGIPSFGPKQLLIRRHTEWVNLWNANCDASRPRGKRDLLHDLEIWEKTQGGNAPAAQGGTGGPGGASSVMAKDFEGSAWSASHRDDFRQLIARARQKPLVPSASSIDVVASGRSISLNPLAASNLTCGDIDKVASAEEGFRRDETLNLANR